MRNARFKGPCWSVDKLTTSASTGLELHDGNCCSASSLSAFDSTPNHFAVLASVVGFAQTLWPLPNALPRIPSIRHIFVLHCLLQSHSLPLSLPVSPMSTHLRSFSSFLPSSQHPLSHLPSFAQRAPGLPGLVTIFEHDNLPVCLSRMHLLNPLQSPSHLHACPELLCPALVFSHFPFFSW